MRLNKWSAMGLAAVAGSVMAVNQASAQQGVPSAAPKPANPQPAPANGQPDPASAQPRPANNPGTVQPQVVPNRPTTPAGQQPVNQQPQQPVNANGQPVTTIGANGQPVVVVPNGSNGNSGSGTVVTGTGLGRYERPFMFQTPGIEARFTENSHRLIGLEQRLATSNQMLLKRLGEVRTLAPEKQNAALADIVQQMLMEQAQMQKYLVLARTAWSGDLEGVPAEMPENAVPTATPMENSQPRGVPTSAVPTSAVPNTVAPTNTPR